MVMDKRLIVGLLLVVLVSGANDEKKPKIRSKIIGGAATNINSAPWTVSLQSSQGSHFCGGVIIGSRTILTAAHCVDSTSSPRSLRIRAGSSLHNSGGTVHGISQIITHPQYNKRSINNDLAVLRTSTPITSGRIIPLITVIPLRNTMAFITGWGSTRNSGLFTSGNKPTQLLGANVPIVSHADCQAAYSQTITDRMICAGWPGSSLTADACQGDSGGPLVVNTNNGYNLAGIVSFGDGCGRKYGVYANVLANRDWIMSYTL